MVGLIDSWGVGLAAGTPSFFMGCRRDDTRRGMPTAG
jgi:hypothetical protein